MSIYKNIYSVDFLVNGGGGSGMIAGIASAEKGADVLVINKQDGTSKLSCSDKMTVYSAINSGPEMLFDILTSCGCAHRDLLQIVAYNAQETFYYLKLSGVPFLTHPETGAVLTYKTDNSPVEDGTSTGPRTAGDIFNVMQKKEKELGINRIEGYVVTKYLFDSYSDNTKVEGAIAIDANAISSEDMDFTIVMANSIGQYTGGPGELFRTTLLPDGATGDLSLALDVQAKLAGMENFQFGLGSGVSDKQPKYATSGDMLRAIPRIVSIDEEGIEREFLREHLSEKQIIEYTFLKGAQYPSVAGKPSCIIDHLVYLEMMKERKVYFDYTRNPIGFNPEFLGDEGKRWYAQRTSLVLEDENVKPIDRLKDIGGKAYLWYLNHEKYPVDLSKEMLEISLANQHVLGGIEIDADTRVIGFENEIHGLYAAGECAAIYGPERPGGSSLMANYVLGRISGIKAAEYSLNRSKISKKQFLTKYKEQIDTEYERLCHYASDNPNAFSSEKLRKIIQDIMTQYGHRVRTKKGVEKAIEELYKIAEEVEKNGIIADGLPICHALETYSILDTAIATMLCIKTRIDSTDGESRGGHFVYHDRDSFNYNHENENGNKIITTVRKDSDNKFIADTTTPRPEFKIPTWEEQARIR